MAEGATPTNDAHGREEDTVVKDPPPSSSTKSRGKASQAYEEEHGGAASSTKLIPKANTDKMKRIDMDDSLESMPVPKINQPPKILSHLNDTRAHSPSRDEDRDHDPRASNFGHDDSTHTGESSITRSTGVVRDGMTSPCAAALAQGTSPKTKSLGKVVQVGITSPRAAELASRTAAALSSMKSDIPVDPKTEENVNSLGKVSSSTLGPMKTVRDALGSEEHSLAVGWPPSSSTKSRGKAIEDYDEEHDGEASSTKIIPKNNTDAGPSVRAAAQHQDGVIAAIGGPAHPNAPDVASNEAPAIAAVPQDGVNVAILAIVGGAAGVGPAAGQPNAARHVPAPAQIIGGAGGIAVIAPAIPVPVLPPNPNPGVNNIDPLMNSGIRHLRNPADGDEGKLWEKLN